ATRFYPGTLEPWVVLHLFYLKTDNNPGADVTLHMIRKIMSGCQKMSRLSDSLSWSARLYDNDTEFLCTAVMLLRMHALDFAEMALAQELLHHGPSTPYFYYISVCHYLGGEPGFAVPHMEDAVRKHGKDCSLWSLMGHCHYRLDAHDRAEECYRYVGESFDRPEDIHLVGLRLADYLMKHKDYRLAKKHYLEVCGVSPSPRSWLGAAVACYMLNELDDCERALAAANALDNTCPVTWGYLALVNLQYHRQPQFQQCLRQALRNRLKTKDEALMSRINALRESIGYPDPLPFSLNAKPA
ncbi:unnamed protein product, partial [Timema podura]|nr:unnamed protein product [Timema podura]